MDEQQILKQLNSLNEEVKPREHWVNMTKKELFENESAQQQQTAATLISKAFTPLQKPIMALTALGLIALTLGSAMFYSPQMVKVDQPMPKVNFQEEVQKQQLAASVEKLDASLKQINERLATVENSNNIQEVIPKLAAIEATAQQGAKLAGQTQTLASLAGEFENTANEARTKSLKIIKTVIDEFEARKDSLTEKEKRRLKNLKRAYEEGELRRASYLASKLLGQE